MNRILLVAMLVFPARSAFPAAESTGSLLGKPITSIIGSLDQYEIEVSQSKSSHMITANDARYALEHSELIDPTLPIVRKNAFPHQATVKLISKKDSSRTLSIDLWGLGLYRSHPVTYVFKYRLQPKGAQEGGPKSTIVPHEPLADRIRDVPWGRAVDGLRAKLLAPVGRKKVGEQVPVVISIRNEGTSTSADGSAVLGPVLRLDIWREGWYKSVSFPVHQLNPESSLRLEKGKEFHYAFDLSRVVDLDVPGYYTLKGGYDSSIATRFNSAWKGGRVTSGSFVTIIGHDHDVPVTTERTPRDRVRTVCETEWGKQVSGLRCKVSALTGTHLVGEPIPVTFTIENLGVPDRPHGGAQLFPHIDLWIKRAGWEKHVNIKLDIKNRLFIRKNDTFSHSIDLSKIANLTVPGEYAISGGHSNGFVKDIGDWTGTVRSPFLNGIVIIKQ